MYNFNLVNLDTDSLSVSKANGDPFSDEEQELLLKELNSLMPEMISWEDDGYYPSVIVIKAKNYVLKDEKGKIKIKGSALKGSMKEKALQQFMKDIINVLLADNKDGVLDIYNNYVREIYNLRDVSRWSSKKTITDKVLNPERTNEQNVLDAIEGEELQEGDKVYVFFNREGKLVLQDKWNNDHDPERLVKKLYSTLEIFDTILDLSKFTKYHLKSHDVKCKLHEVLGLPLPEKIKRSRKKKDELQEAG